MRKLLVTLLLCLLLVPAALAEDVCTVEDASSAVHVTTERAYLKVLCPLEGETNVTLTVHDQWGYLIYQRNYGVCSGTFRSGDVHLPLEGDTCDYTVTLTTTGGEYQFIVTREMAMITDSAVYAGGATLRELTGGSSHKYAAVLDLDALDGQTLTAPMLASGTKVGEVDFTVLGGSLTVSARLTVDGRIDKATVYVAADALTAQTLGSSRFSGVKAKLDRPVDLDGAPYAAVMVQLTITYDPATAQAWDMGPEEEALLETILDNWQLMQLTTANEAVG